MTTPTIQLPPEITVIVNARSRVWDDYDETNRQAAQLNELARQVDGTEPADAIDPLSADKTPPAEIAQTVMELQRALGDRERVESEIRQHQTEIQKIRTGVTRIYIGAGVMVVLILALLVMALQH